jgi:uncharacterized membrane protein
MSTPYWALSIIYWLHMLATVIWIGGLAALALLVLPAARSALEAPLYARLLEAVQRRLDPLGWLCLAVLVGTGLFQMSANPNYQGFLTVGNRWAAAMLIKHIVFFVMTAASAYMTWGLLPALRREALRAAHGLGVKAIGRLQRRQGALLTLNLVLGLLVLLLTALARAA